MGHGVAAVASIDSSDTGIVLRGDGKCHGAVSGLVHFYHRRRYSGIVLCVLL